MTNIFNTWGDTLKNKIHFFSEEVKVYIKLLNGNHHHLRYLVQNAELLKNNYAKVSKALMDKKSELYLKQDNKDWQLDSKDKETINEFLFDRIPTIIS